MTPSGRWKRSRASGRSAFAPAAGCRANGISSYGLNTTAISPGSTTHVPHRTETHYESTGCVDYTTQNIVVALDAAGAVLAVDAFGATARQPYPLTVSAINRPPYFTTPPRTWAAAGQPYAYHAGAEDPDRQALRFELAPGPAGASIHPQTGLLTWTPPAEGSYPMSVPMSVRVVDTLGLEAVQNFSVHVAPLPPNRPPFFRNAPEPVALVGKEYAWHDLREFPRRRTRTDRPLRMAGRIGTMHKSPSELGFVYDEGGINRWILDRSIESDKNFSEDSLSDSCILRCECRQLSFCKADCRNVAWFWNSFEDCDFREADLSGADFRATDFRRCHFDRADLRGAELRGAGFTDCTFTDADVRGARVGYLQSFLMGLSKKQRKEAKRSLLGLPGVPPYY